jgi:cytochrome c peroxidase
MPSRGLVSRLSTDRSILLGKLRFYDRNLSVSRNEACAFFHMPETGFTGPISALNQTTVSYPGSIRTRFSVRNPQTHTYARFSPVLHYKGGQKGTFSIQRSTNGGPVQQRGCACSQSL